MVGFDGSDDAVACVRWAAAQARLQAATLEIVHAYHYPYLERLDPGTRQLLRDEALSDPRRGRRRRVRRGT